MSALAAPLASRLGSTLKAYPLSAGVPAWWPPYTDLALWFGNKYQIGAVRKKVSDLLFARASAAEIILGGSRVAFGVGQPRIHDGALHLDATGATNLIASPEDHSTGWTNDRVTVGALTHINGGTVPFYPLLETVDNNSHVHRRTITTTLSSFGFSAYIKANGRSKIRLQLASNTEGNGFRLDADLAAGTVTSFLKIGTSGASVVLANSGIKALADGVYLVYGTCTLPADSHASVLVYIQAIDDTGTASYAGDAAKGYFVGPVMLNASTAVVDYTATSRLAESISVPLADGYYSFRVRNASADEWRGMVSVAGGSYTLTPPSGSTTITKVEGYKLDYVKDWSADADTSGGDVPGFDVRGAYVSGYPLPASATAHVSSGKVVDSVGNVAYLTKEFDKTIHHMEAVVSWTDTGGAGAEATAAMFATDDPNIISNMPHHTLSRDQSYIGHRIGGGSIVIDQAYNFASNPAENGTQFAWRHSTTTFGTVIESVRNSERQTFSDSKFADSGSVAVGKRAVWEIYQPDAAAGNTLAFHKVAARYRPVVLAD